MTSFKDRLKEVDREAGKAPVQYYFLMGEKSKDYRLKGLAVPLMKEKKVNLVHYQVMVDLLNASPAKTLKVSLRSLLLLSSCSSSLLLCSCRLIFSLSSPFCSAYGS
jgi:hypothetical protein